MRTIHDMTMEELKKFKEGLNDEEFNILIASPKPKPGDSIYNAIGKVM